MILIKTTYPNSPRQCKWFITWLIQWKFAACVNRINGVKSYYVWENKLQSSQELILLIKTLPEKKEACIKYIQKKHPYDTPEITIISAEDNEKYYEWMKSIISQ